MDGTLSNITESSSGTCNGEVEVKNWPVSDVLRWWIWSCILDVLPTFMVIFNDVKRPNDSNIGIVRKLSTKTSAEEEASGILYYATN